MWRQCNLCRLFFHTAWDLANHVFMSKDHRMRLNILAPFEVKELARLQYFLNTHMREEPILGLEYIVEEKLGLITYQYTCLLCNVRGDAPHMLRHIMEDMHMGRYIDKEHGSQSVKQAVYPMKNNYLIALQAAALKIHIDHGRKQVQMASEVSSNICRFTLREGKALLETRKCDLCNVKTNTVDALYFHVTSNGHKCHLKKSAPQKLGELGRLQYFLDTHMPEDAILGLEYVVESQVSASFYKYTCQLCNVKGVTLEMINHVIEVSHAERYINKHHRDRQFEASAYHQRHVYVKSLTKEAFMIQQKYGRKTVSSSVPAKGTDSSPMDSGKGTVALATTGINIESTAVSISVPAKVTDSSPMDSGKGSIALATTGINIESTAVSISVPAKVTDSSPMDSGKGSIALATTGINIQSNAVSSSVPAKVTDSSPMDSGKGSVALATNGINIERKRLCTVCNVTTDSLEKMCKHFMGPMHRKRLSITSPEVRELGRLQYFLDNFMKEDPLLGLDYIVEKKVTSASYKYTCQLCNIEGDLLQTVTHVTGLDHVASYIEKHHSNELSLNKDKHSQGTGYVAALTNAARRVHTSYGRKEIQCEISDVNLQSAARATSLPAEESEEKDAAFPPRKTNKVYPCHSCRVICHSVTELCAHVMGKKHRNILMKTAPDEVEKLGRLQYFLDTHAKKEPILGLEHVVEEQLGSSYKYTCRMCQVKAGFREMLVHIGGEEHIKRYVERSHSKLIESLEHTNKPNFFRGIAYKIHMQFGRKRVSSAISVITGVTPAKIVKRSLVDESQKGHCLPYCLPYNGNVEIEHCSQSNLRMLQYVPEQEIELQKISPSEKLEFQTIDDWLEYLKKFEVEDSEDDSSNQQIHEMEQGTGSNARVMAYTLTQETELEKTSPAEKLKFKTIDDCLEYLRKFEVEDNEIEQGSQSKASPLQCVSKQDTALETTLAEELEFKTNCDFLEYLQHFEIEDSQDASYIQQINQNCTSALLRFYKGELKQAIH